MSIKNYYNDMYLVRIRVSVRISIGCRVSIAVKFLFC